MFYCVFVTFPNRFPGSGVVVDLLIPDLFLLTYFHMGHALDGDNLKMTMLLSMSHHHNVSFSMFPLSQELMGQSHLYFV